jgi:hypothetical protein
MRRAAMTTAFQGGIMLCIPRQRVFPRAYETTQALLDKVKNLPGPFRKVLVPDFLMIIGTHLFVPQKWLIKFNRTPLLDFDICTLLFPYSVARFYFRERQNVPPETGRQKAEQITP